MSLDDPLEPRRDRRRRELGARGVLPRALGERGVLALAKGRRIRFVTHAEVDEASVEAAVAALGDVLAMQRKRRAHA